MVAHLIPAEVLRIIMPVVLIGVAAFFALKPGLSDDARAARIPLPVFGATVVPLVAAYDGFFGPGTGSFFMMGFVLLAGTVAEPILGKEAKLLALQEITARLGISPAEAIAVGDGANDLPMLLAAGTGVALHAKPRVQAECEVRVNHGDLTALLYLQGYSREEFARV